MHAGKRGAEAGTPEGGRVAEELAPEAWSLEPEIWPACRRRGTLGHMSDSPVDQLLDQLRAALHAGRADVLRRVDAIEQALVAYRNSAEQRVALDFAMAHDLRRPAPPPLTPRQAAERLLSLVRSLPELVEESAGGPEVGRSSSPSSAPDSKLGSESAGDGSTTVPLAGAPLAVLTAHCIGRKLVVIGALAGRSKECLLPPLLEECTEWVDTERDGVHAIGNLPQRIRQQRVAAVVILDRAVQHKHTEPILAAARDTNTPVAFAGKGGRASLLRAVEQLDKRLEA